MCIGFELTCVDAYALMHMLGRKSQAAPPPDKGYRMHTFFDLMSSVGEQDKVKG